MSRGVSGEGIWCWRQVSGPVQGEQAQRSLGTPDFGEAAFPLSGKSISNKVEKLTVLRNRTGHRWWGRGWERQVAQRPHPLWPSLPSPLVPGAWSRGCHAPLAEGLREVLRGGWWLAGGWQLSCPRLGRLPGPGLSACLFPVLASGNLDKQTAKGSTALHYCCLTDNAECLKLLLRGKASIEIGERRRPAPGGCGAGEGRAEAAALSKEKLPLSLPRVPQGAESGGHCVGTEAEGGPRTCHQGGAFAPGLGVVPSCPEPTPRTSRVAGALWRTL